ncbi:GNAT family N-acetyltransferase [uncultured Methylobacterium sp.]|uniref:GNAT family N-acetyltransferase n=1 Tax=uncultured Methylobacterium sp. TaxID=157278 RepID=UPI0035CC8B77
MGSRYGLEIRAAAAGDAPGLADLLAACGRPVPARDLADRIDALRREEGAALVAVEWGPPGGLVVLHWYRTLQDAAPVAQITTLLVGLDDRRRGVGRLLLKAASQAARSAGCGSLHLLAESDRPELSAFCAATGFTQAGIRFDRPLRKAG